MTVQVQSEVNRMCSTYWIELMWLEFRSPVYEHLYWEYFTRAYLRVDLYVTLVNIAFGAVWIGKVGRSSPWQDIAAIGTYLIVHLCQFALIWQGHPFFLKHRHAIVTADRLLSSLFLVQGHWRLIKFAGLTHDWDSIVANVLGFGTGTNLAWHAIMHRLPFNRSLALLLLQFCLLVGTNGLIVDAMHTEFGDKLKVGAQTVNSFAALAFGKRWPRISGTAYFAVVFCGLRQLVVFFYIAWFLYKMELGHRRAFLLQYNIDPETCGFSHATMFDASFLVANVFVVTGTMSNDLLDLYGHASAGKHAMKDSLNLTAGSSEYWQLA